MTCPKCPFDLTATPAVRSDQGPDRNDADSDRSGAPIHAQTPDRKRSGQVRSGDIGHLTAVPAAYKRGQGDRSADREDLMVRLEVAEATNRVLTEIIYELVGPMSYDSPAIEEKP